jgi:hypothetical protein
MTPAPRLSLPLESQVARARKTSFLAARSPAAALALSNPGEKRRLFLDLQALRPGPVLRRAES